MSVAINVRITKKELGNYLGYMQYIEYKNNQIATKNE